MALSRPIDWLIETLSSSWKAPNHSRRVSLSGLLSRLSIRLTSREKISATSLAQVSQYFRSPHFSTTLANIAPGRQAERRKGQFGGARSVDPVLCQNSALLKDHGCNLMHRKVLVSFYQHLMAEAPMRSV